MSDPNYYNQHPRNNGHYGGGYFDGPQGYYPPGQGQNGQPPQQGYYQPEVSRCSLILMHHLLTVLVSSPATATALPAILCASLI